MRENLRSVCAAGIVAVGGLLAGLGVLPVGAQGGEVCAQVVERVSASAAACSGLAPGTLCAGSAPVDIVARSGEAVAPALSLPLAGIVQITTGGLDPASARMGIALLRVPGVGADEYLTAVLFGGAVLTNEPGTPIAPACSAVSIGTVNVRAGPNTDSAILGQLGLNQSAPVTARLSDSSWWRILWNGEPAWVFAELAPATCDPAHMLVFDPITESLSGGQPAPDFQNVRLVTDFAPPACAGAPRGGLLLQTEAGEATWIVNGILLSLNGTALLQASPDDVLAVHVLEGQVTLEAGGVTRLAAAGQLLRVPLLGGELQSLPGPALDVVLPDAAGAPLALLPRPVTPLPVTAAAPAPPPDALGCDLLPQSITVPPEGQRAQIRLFADADQTVRVSASPVNAEARLSVQTPGGGLMMFEGPSGSDAARSEGVLAADVVTAETGFYTFEVEGATEAAVRFGVTCGLPRPAPLPALQSCEAMLLWWEGVSGSSVRFSAPLNAQISVIAEHPLPSQGPAATLDVLTDSGEQLGQASFVTFRDRQAAGPLDLLLPRDGTYVIRWDGDPFNVMDIEAVCLPPESASPTG